MSVWRRFQGWRAERRWWIQVAREDGHVHWTSARACARRDRETTAMLRSVVTDLRRLET